ncbi:MAG: TRAM domain-containing protein, partial [Vibrio sp.]
MANFSRNASFYKPKKATSLNQKHLVVRVEALDNLGAGIAYSDLEYVHQTKKTPIFIDGALPDETVRIQLTEQKAKYARAKLIAVDKPSEIRIKPNCPHFAECGGCQLQHMPHQAQVAYKSETLLNLFKKISPQAQASSELAAPVISPEFGYRRRARISLMYDQKKQALAFGFRQSGSHQITQVKQCPVLVPQLDALLPELRILLENFDKPRTLGHLELVYDGEQVAVLLRHTQALTESAKESLMSFAN